MKNKIIKAPAIKEMQDFEEQNKIMTFKREKIIKLAIQNKTKEANKKNAGQIIEQLSKMFQDKKVTSQKGCSICGIPPEICSDGVLAIINEYLNGEWSAEFKSNTGNSDDFEMTNTLLIKPRILLVR